MTAVVSCFAGDQGARNNSASFHRVLDAVFSHQRHIGLLSVVSRPVVRRRRRRDSRRLVGLRVVHGQSDRLHSLQRGVPCRFLSHLDV